MFENLLKINFWNVFPCPSGFLLKYDLKMQHEGTVGVFSNVTRNSVTRGRFFSLFWVSLSTFNPIFLKSISCKALWTQMTFSYMFLKTFFFPFLDVLGFRIFDCWGFVWRSNGGNLECKSCTQQCNLYCEEFFCEYSSLIRNW